MICNFVQLHLAIQTHLRGLYAMCILFGSAFTAIEMCNSNLFHLSLFKNQRIYSIVLVENICNFV